MNTTAAAVNKSTANTNKQQTAKEVIAANVQALIEQLEQGHSDALTAYLTAMGRFHNYSFGNILEIARQKPDATRVAGLYAWNQLGRKVKKGEHGIRILAPVIGVRRKKDEEAEKDIRTQNQAVLVGFRAAYVFDVSQTEGKELPEFSERVSGSAGEYRDRLVDFVIAQGIALEFKESIAPALGMSYGGKIALLPGQSKAEEFSTLDGACRAGDRSVLCRGDRRRPRPFAGKAATRTAGAGTRQLLPRGVERSRSQGQTHPAPRAAPTTVD
jgi:hypothetical protein